jgi:nitroreductase
MKKTFATLGILSCLLTGCQCKQQEATAPLDENPVITTIMARRSIRKYQPQAVEREKMDVILKCGINAPNGQNKQSWEVRVVDNPAFMAEIKEAMAKGHPDMNPEMVKGCFRDAPTMVFIARDKSYDFSAYDCGLLAENMMLSAWSMGVGSICLGSPVRFLTDNDACLPILEKLGFSEGYELALCVGFGYADEAPAAKPRDWGKVKYVD